MDTEDDVIWRYGVGDDQFMAFTDLRHRKLTELIRIRRKTPNSSRGGIGDPLSAGPAWMDTANGHLRPEDMSACSRSIRRLF